jgi:hypothetical protein
VDRVVVNEVSIEAARPRAVRVTAQVRAGSTLLGSSAFFSNALSVCESQCAD